MNLTQTVTEEMPISLQASDVSGQKVVNANHIPMDVSVAELIQGLLARMGLPANDVGGRPLTYHARLEREGRNLHSSERVGDSLETGDRVVLQPNIDAGRS